MEELKDNAVLFDPGFAQHTTILSVSAEYIYKSVNQFKNFGQRKMKFRMLYPQILRMVDNNVGFCLGSLLWAVYIKGAEPDANITGNPCLGDTYNEDETVEEVNYSIKFFDKLKRDAKYYIGEDYDIAPLHIEILELYKEFIVLNMNFVNTKTVADLKLPEELKIPSETGLKSINSKIQEVIQSGNLLDLKEVLPLVYQG